MAEHQESPATRTIEIPNIPPRSNRKIDANKAIELRLKGLSYQDIANTFGASKEAAHELINRHVPNIDDLATFKTHKADIFAAKQSQLIKSLTPAAIEKIPPGSRVMSLGILYDKERMERGLATSNVEIHEISGEYKANAVKLQAIQDELEDLAGDDV